LPKAVLRQKRNLLLFSVAKLVITAYRRLSRSFDLEGVLQGSELATLALVSTGENLRE
jgi:hypothetical protein